ncbi:MAG: alpha/beta fold hydrolase [Planctomycetes bacterium]|nr:alpha/beta fold hydrolase [Planctomycetota bacterium]
MKNLAKRSLYLLSFAYVCVCALTFLPGCIEYFLLHPEKIDGGISASEIAEASESGAKIEIEESGGYRLDAAWFPVESPRATALISHGNARSLRSFRIFAKFWNDVGCSAMLYDYTGFGGSEGDIDVDVLAHDAESALAKLLTLEGVDPEKIVGVGISLGTTVSMHLAKEKKVAGVFLDGLADIPYEIHARDMFVLYPLALCFSAQVPVEMDVRSLAPLCKVPAIFVHGDADPICSYDASSEVCDLYAGEKKFVGFENVSHTPDTLYKKPDEYKAAAEQLLAWIGAPPAETASGG